ncbi:hypothetical protein CK203_075199 [Vitis vinifera]|uniref:Uncharacterized protein n=1 Tax=Vitis vinifera TaxID=29760 RepID=A0A438F6F8_VITVI|nr:hypothetical protein CK203_075199 [Vitis vinifera]
MELAICFRKGKMVELYFLCRVLGRKKEGYAFERKVLWKQIIGGKYGEEEGGWRSCEVRDAYGLRLRKTIRSETS